MNRNQTILYIPLKRHIKQYYEKEYGGQGIVKINLNSMLGQLVQLCTDKVPYRFALVRKADRKDMLKLLLPQRMKHFTMSDDQRENMTRVLEKLFHDDLYKYIKSQAGVTGSEWGAIRCFAEVYDLDTESFDIDKMYKLWRDRKNTITNDNREAIEAWYRTHRLHPDASHELLGEREQLDNVA